MSQYKTTAQFLAFLMQLPNRYAEWNQLIAKRKTIEQVWSFFADYEGQHLVLPDGRCDIILRFIVGEANAPRQVIPIIAGPTELPHLSKFSKDTGFIGLRFRPGFARLVLDVSPYEIKDQILCGADAIKLMPVLASLQQPTERVSVLVRRLDRFAQSRKEAELAPSLQSAIDQLHLTGGRMSVAELASATRTTERTLSRWFRTEIGLSPKAFSSILRFHRALRLIQQPGISAAAVATEAGYTDQAHMIRDFRRHSHFTPKTIPLTAIAPLPS